MMQTRAISLTIGSLSLPLATLFTLFLRCVEHVNCIVQTQIRPKHRIRITKKANSGYFHGNACKVDSYVKTRLNKPESSSV